MEDDNRQRDDSIGQIVDDICDTFEAAWKASRTDGVPAPDIENFATSQKEQTLTPSAFAKLVGELVAIDVAYRAQDDTPPSLDDYLTRFPQAADEIRDQFEQAAKTELHNPTESLQHKRPEIEAIQATSEYDEIRFHAEGGLGEVYHGFDRQLHREVAIKCIHLEHITNRDICERFRIEAEVTSRLDHPGIVPVYTMGTDSLGRPFYVMRFIEGRTLRSAIDDFHATDWSRQGGRSAWRLELHRLLRHLIDACNAVAYAHNRGVLHRDIKPENIMIGKFGETLLVDWGLAQFVQRDARAKASGEKTLFADYSSDHPDGSGTSGTGAGTIGYISPEQLPGEVVAVGPRSDIYSLGATLYKLLTGSTPFHRDPDRRVWDEIRAGQFPSPREVNSKCPAALEAICLKAMSVQPALRYDTAEQFARDLDRWMADEPVTVYREPLAERFLRRARRHRAGTIAAGIGTAAILVIAIASSIIFGRLAESEASLRVRAEKAQKETEEARLSHLQSTAVFAARAIGYEIDQRWRILQRLAENPKLRELLADTKVPEDAEKSPVDSPEWHKIEQWLQKEASESVDSRQAVSWFIVNRQGIQVARYPWKKTIGKPFYHRSYFHAGPHNLPETTPLEEVRPIDGPKVSAVYLSSGTKNDFKVAFSVPIYDNDDLAKRKFLGILGMSVELGRFTQLPERRERMSVALADLRPDQLEGETQAGLILDHPSFKDATGTDTTLPLIRLPEEVVTELEAKREACRASKSSFMLPTLIESFTDPASPNSKGRSTAMQCVFLPVSASTDPTSHATRDVGWVVIIQDKEK
ncbi:MAG: serine/threonine protein kinase [Planctomycetia bacterium]|jgi:serine/threonine-protein kinase